MASTATITWVGVSGGISYLVEYKQQSSPTYIIAPGTNPTTNLTYTIPVDSGTAYHFRVTTNCATGTGPQVIPGTSICIPVTGLAASFSGTTANLVWDRLPEAVSYKIEFRLQGSPTWTLAPSSPVLNPGSGTTVSTSIPSLSGGATYEFQVSINCRANVSVGSTTTATSSCPAPINLQVTFS